MSTTSAPVSSSMAAPMSPRSRDSLLQEKQDLAELNDRLARYVDKVQLLEAENSRLARELLESKEVLDREKAVVEAFYKGHLADARDHHNACVRDKAQLEIRNKQLSQDVEELKSKLQVKIENLQINERSLTILESRCNRIQLERSQLQAESKKSTDHERELEREVNRLSKLLHDTKKLLEIETILRTELESRNESLRDNMSFKEQMYQQEIYEFRTRHQLMVSEIDGKLSEQYEKQKQSFQNLRNQFARQILANQEALRNIHEKKLHHLASHTQQSLNFSEISLNEIQQSRKRIVELDAKVADLEDINTALNNEIRRLENLKKIQQKKHTNNVALLESKLNKIKDEMEQQHRENNYLRDTRIDLKLEINAYKKLLGLSGEARLIITPISTAKKRLSEDKYDTLPMQKTFVSEKKRKFAKVKELEGDTDE